MEPCIKLWIERDGRLALSDYRVRLLAHVRETGSLAQAAARMRLSYRRAWGKIKEIEQNLGVALVTSEAGGVGGGHTRLTPEGERLVALYQEFQARMHQALAREFAAVFGALDHQRLSANGGKRGEP
jgi:molybdate transport system regulatory protein